MLRFEPPELREDLLKALELLTPLMSVSMFWGYSQGKFNDQDYADDDHEIVNRASTVSTFVGHEETEVELTVAFILHVADLLKRFKLENRTVLRMDDRTLFHVEPANDEAVDLVRAMENYEIGLSETVSLGDADFGISLITGLTEFAFFIEKEGRNADEFCPCFYRMSTFVQIHHPKGTAADSVDSVAYSYLFEVAASTSLMFSLAPYPEHRSLPVEFKPQLLDMKLRPLKVGPGLGELYKLFVAGCAASPHDYAFIHFMKIVEYVSATVIRLTRHDALRRRLTTKIAMQPDAAFLDSLTDLVEEHRSFSKDAEAIKLTILTCCDAITLRSSAPKFLKEFRKLEVNQDPKQQKAALEELSACLSATRNKFSHAKANYGSSGSECPDEQLECLMTCAKVVAEQVIRWFADRPENARII